MKLSKKEIQYIDQYLIRSGVTFWDLRAEIIDHFIVAIEEKIQADNCSFEEALLEVTEAFGNTVQKRYLLNKDRTKVLFSGTFSDGKGFKELEKEKRKQVRKQYAKQYWIQFNKNLYSPNFYINYLLFGLCMYVLFDFFNRWFLAGAIAWFFIEIIVTLYQTIKNKAAKKALYVDVSAQALSVYLILICHTHFFLNLRKASIAVFFGVLLTYLIIKTSMTIHNNIYKKHKKYYDLVSS